MFKLSTSIFGFASAFQMQDALKQAQNKLTAQRGPNHEKHNLAFGPSGDSSECTIACWSDGSLDSSCSSPSSSIKTTYPSDQVYNDWVMSGNVYISDSDSATRTEFDNMIFTTSTYLSALASTNMTDHSTGFEDSMGGEYCD